MNRTGPIVIIGGMGPQASAAIHKLIVDKAAANFAASRGTDFPEIIVHSIPVPEFMSNRSNMTEAHKMLRRAINQAKRYRPSVVVMACNTAHLLFDELKKETRAPMVSLIDIVCKEVAAQDVKSLGLLASPTTLATKLYQRTLADKGIMVSTLSSADNAIVEKIIHATIGGNATNMAKELNNLVAKLLSGGNKAVLLGCTELPIVFDGSTNLNIINCNDVLADFLLKEYYKSRI